jgi:hypothetical protein
MKRSRWVLAAGGIAGLLAVYLVVTPFVRDQMLHVMHAWRERNDGAELAHRLVSTESLLEYTAEHPDQVALASWEIGDESNGIFFNAWRSQPAAHVSALLVLAAYASEADPEGQGRAPVSLARWERYWLPGVDSGAHVAALLEARSSGALADERGPLLGAAASLLPIAEPSGNAHLRDVVRAMVRHADPAATDVLIDHLGRTQLTQRVLGLGFPAEAVPLPASGVQLSMLTDVAAPELLARFRAQRRSGYADAVWQDFIRLRDDGEFRARSLERLEQRGSSFGLRETAELTAALSPRGSPAAYAHLLQQVVTGELHGAGFMREQLEQPLRAAGTPEELEAFGSLRGSQPGVYASVTYARTPGSRSTRVLALMMRNLPMGVWLHLSSGYLLRSFEAQLLGEQAFAERVKLRLAAPSGRRQEGVEAAASRLERLHGTAAFSSTHPD